MMGMGPAPCRICLELDPLKPWSPARDSIDPLRVNSSEGLGAEPQS